MFNEKAHQFTWITVLDEFLNLVFHVTNCSQCQRSSASYEPKTQAFNLTTEPSLPHSFLGGKLGQRNLKLLSFVIVKR